MFKHYGNCLNKICLKIVWKKFCSEIVSGLVSTVWIVLTQFELSWQCLSLYENSLNCLNTVWAVLMQSGLVSILSWHSLNCLDNILTVLIQSELVSTMSELASILSWHSLTCVNNVWTYLYNFFLNCLDNVWTCLSNVLTQSEVSWQCLNLSQCCLNGSW